MNDLERLRLLLTVLDTFTPTVGERLGKLANDIESVCSSIGSRSEAFDSKYFTLWDALEIIGVAHQEAGTTPSVAEIADVKRMVADFRIEVVKEIEARGSLPLAP